MAVTVTVFAIDAIPYGTMPMTMPAVEDIAVIFAEPFVAVPVGANVSVTVPVVPV